MDKMYVSSFASNHLNPLGELVSFLVVKGKVSTLDGDFYEKSLV